jgi:cell wall integrity and stress response component
MMFPSTYLATSLATTFVALLMASTCHALDGAQNPTLQGCYSSDQGLTYNNTNIYQSRGACQLVCFPMGKAVMAMTGGNECYCGDEMPPLSTEVDISKCSAACVGWTPDNCMSSQLICRDCTNLQRRISVRINASILCRLECWLNVHRH